MRYQPQTTPAGPIGTAWELYDRIRPVALAYGAGPRLYVAEYQSARRLLRELWRLGRKRIRIRALICEHGAASQETLRALNCYLQHHFSRQSLAALAAGRLHRWTWYDVQNAVPLVWI